MFHVIFLVALALVWMIFAVVQDLRKREIANTLLNMKTRQLLVN